MATFIAKQMIGSKLNSVKDLAGEKKEEGGGDTETVAADDPELIEARREQEEKRRQKYAKMESDRETVRQGIRDKYKIQKKEEPINMLQLSEGALNRQKKTPAQLAISTEDDEFNPVKMATDFFGNVKTSITNILPWGGGGGAGGGAGAKP